MPNKIGEYLYNSLPPIYRIKDIETNYTLQKYLDTLGQPMSEVQEEIKKILNLLDVEKMDTKYLPYYSSMFGITYSYDIPEDFQRKYLANLVDIQKRKGTKEVLEFTARELTGMTANIREGSNAVFKTWKGRNARGLIYTSETDPKTYSDGRNTFYYAGGENTDRFTVTVILSADKNTNDDEIFLNTQLISRCTKDLVQPYINLRYKAYGISYTDERYVSDIAEEDRIIVKEATSRKINAIEGSYIYTQFDEYSDTYKHKLVEKSTLESISLLECDSDLHNNIVAGYDEKDSVFNRVPSDNISVNIEDIKKDSVFDRVFNDIPVNVEDIKNDFIYLSNEDISEVNYEEEQSMDYIHSDIINDIINLGETISDSFEDIITKISNDETTE